MSIRNRAGNELNSVYSRLGQALQGAYDKAGNAIFGSGAGPFEGIKWIPIGDSLSDLTAGFDGTPDRPSNKKYQKFIKDLIPQLTVYNSTDGEDYNNGQRYCIGGAGYASGTNWYGVADRIPQGQGDADIITIMGSPNDWKYRQLSCTYPNKLCRINNRTEATDPSNGSVTWAVDPHLDEPTDGTLAGYINGTFERLHAKCPNAKIIVITPAQYIGAGSIYFANVIAMYNMCVMGWRQHRGASDWLFVRNIYIQPTISETNESGQVKYTRSDAFVNDETVVDTDLAGNRGLTIDSRKIELSYYAGTKLSGSDEDFAMYYTYDYYVGAGKWGHMTNAYHQRYLSRKVAHWMLEVLYPNMTATEIDDSLPEELRYNGEK